MFESLDTEREREQTDDPVTVTEALGVLVLILSVAFGSVFAFVALGDRPYGMQWATLISYSAVIFVWTFFRTRGVFTKHSLFALYVHEQLPRLLMIHFVYLLAIFLMETWALTIRPTMSGWWLTSSGRRGVPPFDSALMVSGLLTGASQIILNRRILGRAKKESLSNSAEVVQ
jgi:hypothetical protein